MICVNTSKKAKLWNEMRETMTNVIKRHQHQHQRQQQQQHQRQHQQKCRGSLNGAYFLFDDC